MSLYDTLGVSNTATETEIKKAWRKKSSEAHPDKEGGSEALMTEVNKAYEILSDATKRARYDKDGSTVEPYSLEAQAMENLAAMLKAIIEQGHTSILTALNQLLDQNVLNISSQIGTLKSNVAKYDKKRGKVKVKKGINLVDSLIDAQISSMNSNITTLEKHLEILRYASAMIEDWEEDLDSNSYGHQLLMRPFFNNFGGQG